MTPVEQWHPGHDQLQAYAVAGDAVLAAASVEAHLIACGRCRTTVAQAVRPDRLESVRLRLDDRLDTLTRPRLERLLCRLGLSEPDARVLLAAPSVRLAWGLAVATAVLLAVLMAAQDDGARGAYLLLAPLIPAGATALAYAPRLDPATAIVAATPYRAVRLLLLRSLAVGSTAALALGVAALAVPARDAAPAGWLLPALALTLAILGLAPQLGTAAAAGLVGGAWCAVVVGLHQNGLDPLLTYSATGQLVSAGLAALALAVLVHRWPRLDDGGFAL